MQITCHPTLKKDEEAIPPSLVRSDQGGKRSFSKKISSFDLPKGLNREMIRG
jgi:hypothetical protein